MSADFFLSANSGDGVQTLSGPSGERDWLDCMIVKGGTDGARVLFLNALRETLTAAGEKAETFSRPDDPEELDGVLFPGLRCAAVDGAQPHPREPRYPGAVDRIVDLSRFSDVTAAKENRAELMMTMDAARAAQMRAFHSLKAARQLELEGESAAQAHFDHARLERRTAGIIARELRKKGREGGRYFERFLGSATSKGYVWRFEEAAALCPKCYVFSDAFGLAAGSLESLAAAATANGWNAVLLRCPEEPGRIEHLLVPGLGLAFFTSKPGMEFPGTPYRHIRVDAMTKISNRARLRFEQRLAKLLRDEATVALRDAREERRVAEEMLAPYIDTDGIRALAALEAGRLLSWRG